MLDKDVDDLIHIAAAGGGFSLDSARHSVDDLTRIAAAAAGTGTRIAVSRATRMSTEDLIRIATAGRGAVIFD